MIGQVVVEPRHVPGDRSAHLRSLRGETALSAGVDARRQHAEVGGDVRVPVARPEKFRALTSYAHDLVEQDAAVVARGDVPEACRGARRSSARRVECRSSSGESRLHSCRYRHARFVALRTPRTSTRSPREGIAESSPAAWSCTRAWHDTERRGRWEILKATVSFAALWRHDSAALIQARCARERECCLIAAARAGPC